MKRYSLCRIKHILLFVAFITIVSMALSYSIGGVTNPIRSLSSLFLILTDKSTFAVISEDPKVMLAQPNEVIFIDYMEGLGFTEIEEEHLGSIRVFTNGEAEEIIVYKQNRFFSQWKWEKQYENKGHHF